MTEKWVIVELSAQGTEKDPEELECVLNETAGRELDYFFPSTTFTKRDSKVTISLMEGYIFIEGGYGSTTYYDLENTTYISQVLSHKDGNNRELLYADQSDVDDLKEKLRKETVRDIKVGDRVLVKDGNYENLEGDVIALGDDEDQDRVYVDIDGLKSIDSKVSLPKVFLEKIG